MPRKYFFLIIKIKRTGREIVNVNDNKENFNEKLNLQNDKRDDSIDIDGVD